MGLRAQLLVSQLSALRGAGSASGLGLELCPWWLEPDTGIASPDFLLCPDLGSCLGLLYLASFHPQGMQLLRNSQLLPSPTLSFQTKPLKTDPQWQLQPHWATVRFHHLPQALKAQPCQVHMEPGQPLPLGCSQERSSQEHRGCVQFSWSSCSSSPLSCEYRLPSQRSCGWRKALHVLLTQRDLESFCAGHTVFM